MITLKNVSKWYGHFQVLTDCSTEVKKGEVVVVCGPSGSGKSTLIKTVNGLEPVQQGEITVDGIVVNDKKTDLAKLRSRVGMVFQHFELFPHLSIIENLTLAQVKVLKRNKAPAREKALKLLERVGLSAHANKFPAQLSGGQQQRVGVARALAADPQVLLMDEPFGALDPVTRGALQQEMTRIHRLQGRTIVLVTHDIDEALRLAEHLVLMDHGEVVQQGNPLAMLTHPANDFVRQFFGHSELGVRLLSLRSVADYVRREERAEGEALAEEMTLRDALSLFVARGCEVLPVVNTQGEPCGTLHFQDLLEEA
ncbi:ATP-binding cassette domain-containing protein [Escherichia coli]|uniref:ATP-binding cassette domain-containing protein n=3 Tax=Escherichia coli TaxID=562 RepID=UPI000376CBC1|nr:ABC transporter ATP-binding protein [Escherichia coli]